MGLQSRISDLEDVSEKDRSLYVEQEGGGYGLHPAFMEVRDKLGTFRENNRSLMSKTSEQEEALAKLKDLDPEKYQAGVDAMAKLAEIDDKKMIDAGQIDELIDQRTERMRSTYEGQVEALNKSVGSLSGERDTLKGRLGELLIDSAVQKELAEVAAMRPGAQMDVLSRAHGVWNINEEGDIVPMDGKGNVMYGTDGKAQLTMKEWATSLMDTAPFLFEASRGGGSKGSDTTTTNTGTKTIDASDADAIAANLDGISSGEYTVVGLE